MVSIPKVVGWKTYDHDEQPAINTPVIGSRTQMNLNLVGVGGDILMAIARTGIVLLQRTPSHFDSQVRWWYFPGIFD